MNVFRRNGFGSAIKLVSFNGSQMVTFNSKLVCGFRNGNCGIESQSDNTVGSPHRIIIHWIVISKNIKKVTEVIDVENWRVDNSRVLRHAHDESLIVEILELKDDVADNGSATWFLQELAIGQSAEGTIASFGIQVRLAYETQQGICTPGAIFIVEHE
nr:hypothetical protein [Tanacetum cinerariifolium]